MEFVIKKKKEWVESFTFINKRKTNVATIKIQDTLRHTHAQSHSTTNARASNVLATFKKNTHTEVIRKNIGNLRSGTIAHDKMTKMHAEHAEEFVRFKVHRYIRFERLYYRCTEFDKGNLSGFLKTFATPNREFSHTAWRTWEQQRKAKPKVINSKS